MTFAGQAHVRHVGSMSTENYAIVELAMAHLQRLENIGIVSHGDSGHQLDVNWQTRNITIVSV
jgi:hypothetical protein